MKISEQRLNEARRQRTEAIVAGHVYELFQRLPMLCGFWLRPDLEVDELSVFTWPGYTAGRELYDEVMQSLVELAEERPDAMQLMRGQTFARGSSNFSGESHTCFFDSPCGHVIRQPANRRNQKPLNLRT